MCYSSFSVLYDNVEKVIDEYKLRIERLQKHLHHCSEYDKVLIMSTNLDAYKEFVRELEKALL